MKFTINGKQLKDITNIITLKGKYNQGMGNKTQTLPNQVYIVAEENMVYFHNGDPATYVVYRYETEAEVGSVVLSSTMLEKYLTNEDVVLSAKNDQCKLLIGDSSIVTLPTLERSQHLNVVVRLKSFLQNIDRNTIREQDSTKVTDKLSMSTWIDVPTDELIDAMNLAEKVGNSVYKLEMDGDEITVSSSEGKQTASTLIDAYGHKGGPATVEVSLPVGNILKNVGDRRTTILFEDERPVVIATEKITILRAPRQTS